MIRPNFQAPSARTPFQSLIAVCAAAALIGLCACTKEKDGEDDKPVQASPPSQTTASAPEPSVGGVPAPPNGQAPNGAATVNDKVVKH